jgi:hypothetical protein
MTRELGEAILFAGIKRLEEFRSMMCLPARIYESAKSLK